MKYSGPKQQFHTSRPCERPEIKESTISRYARLRYWSCRYYRADSANAVAQNAIFTVIPRTGRLSRATTQAASNHAGLWLETRTTELPLPVLTSSRSDLYTLQGPLPVIRPDTQPIANRPTTLDRDRLTTSPRSFVLPRMEPSGCQPQTHRRWRRWRRSVPRQRRNRASASGPVTQRARRGVWEPLLHAEPTSGARRNSRAEPTNPTPAADQPAARSLVTCARL